MLHISKGELKKQLLARLDDPTKRWKHDPRTWWSGPTGEDHQPAYDDALNRCSTDAAPRYVVPADRRWYRNWAVATLLRQAFADVDPRDPEPDFDVAAERNKLIAAP
jgi:polyphosphate kinase 2 (PPK2 family)